MAKIREQIKAPRRELSNKEIANLSDAEFKTLVIRILTEIVKYGHKTEEEVNPMQSERKINRKPTVMGRKLGLKSTI